MRGLLKLVSRLGRDEDGVALVEYAVLLGVMLAISVATFTALGTSSSTVFTSLSTMLAGV